jgi:hypothetical protein
MSALIGALRVSLSAETAQFEAGMKRAQRTAQQTESSFKKSFGGLGNVVKAGLAGAVSGLSVGLLVQGAKAALDYAGSLGEVAQQLGVTTRELQVFRFAVQQNGGTVEQADQALGKFAIAISKALAGSKQATAAFGAMGVSLNDLQNKSKTEVLGQIADQMKATGGASANAAAGVAIFGRGFQKIIPVLDQGSAGFNELAAAADELGIVLSEEQIQNADKTADKLDALMTVLKAKIAGEVADNTDSIFSFIDALFELVRAAEAAREAIVNFQRNYNLPNLLFKGAAFGKGVAGKSVTTDLSSGGSALALAKKMGLKVAGTGSGVSGGGSQFLASGGGGGGRSKRGGGRDDTERKRQEALRAAFQFDQELLRAQQDVLRAQQQLSTDYSERAALSIQMLNLEQQSFQREMDYAVASGDLTKAQAAQLEAEFAKTDELERQAVLAEEETRRREDYAMLDEKDFDIKMDILEKQADLADTWQERRAIEHKILDLAYEEERNRLERIVRESQDWAEIEAARRDLLALTKKQSLDRQGVNRNTMGPFESAQVQFGDLSEEMENLKVQGLMGLSDAFATLITDTENWKQATISAIKSVIAEFIRLQTMKFLMNLAGSAMGAPGAGSMMGGGMGGMGMGSSAIGGMSSLFGGVDPMFLGGLTGFATGGGFTIGGNRGVDQNVMSLNGLPIARVSHGERVNISNDNGGRAGGGMNMTLNFSGPVSKETMMQAGARVRSAVASANRKGA